MSEKYYRNVETEEVIVVADGAEDVCVGVMVEGTTNELYREVSAAEAGVEPVVAEEVPAEEAPAPAEEEAPAEEVVEEAPAE